MKTPTQYQYDLDQLLADPSGKPDLEKLNALETELIMDLQAKKMQFMGRAASHLGSFSKQGGRERAENEKRLEDEKQAKLKPYEDLLEKVQELIKQNGK